MVSVPDVDLPLFLKRKADVFNGLLLYGNDDPGLSTVAQGVVRSFMSDEEPLHLSATILRSDPLAIDLAFRSMSLLGGRRLIVVDGCEEAHAPHLLSIIDCNVSGNFVLLVASSLSKSSRLREAAERAQRFGAVAVYQENEADTLVRIQRMFSAMGLTIEEEAGVRFVSLVGHDRGLAVMEAEKVALYCLPRTIVTMKDIEASCGDGGGRDVDGLIESVLNGDVEETDRSFEACREDGRWRQVLIMLQVHLGRLETVAALLERSTAPEVAFRMLKPPAFPALQRVMQRQLRIFSLADLGRAQATLQQAILQSRECSTLDEVISARALMTLAHTARQLRNRKLG